MLTSQKSNCWVRQPETGAAVVQHAGSKSVRKNREEWLMLMVCSRSLGIQNWLSWSCSWFGKRKKSKKSRAPPQKKNQGKWCINYKHHVPKRVLYIYIFVSVSNVQSLTLRFTDGPVLLPRVAIHSKRGRKWEKMDQQFTTDWKRWNSRLKHSKFCFCNHLNAYLCVYITYIYIYIFVFWSS